VEVRATVSRTAGRAGCWSRTRADLACGKEAVRGCARTASRNGQCTVARRRLVAWSSANRPSCQGVC
jgi:hypothetical protein